MKKNDGYIALVSALVLSLIVIAVTFAVSLSGFLSRFNILASYTKESSAALAEACVETARLKLIQSSSYAGNEIIAIGTGTCTIYPLETPVGAQRIIKAAASTERSTTNLRVTVTADDAAVVSWEETSAL